MNEQTNLNRQFPLSERTYFCVVFLLISVVGALLLFNVKEVQSTVLTWQIVTSLTFLFSLSITKRWSISLVLAYVFVYQLLFSYVLQEIFRLEGASIFGYQALDSLLYDKIARACYRSSLSETVAYIAYDLPDVSDLGFPLYLKYIYGLAGDPEKGVLLLVFCNVVAQVLTTWLLYMLGMMLLQSRKQSVLLAVLWGCNTASIYYNVAGLKETLFAFLCTGAIYLFYKAKEERRVWYHLIFLLLVASIWFFRYYMSLFFLIVYVGFIFFTKLSNTCFKWLCMAAILLCIVFTEILGNYFVEIKYAMMGTEEFFMGKGVLFKLMSYILAFICPIPRLFNMDYSGDLLVVTFSMVKFFGAIYTLLGVYRIIKTKQTQFYPIITLILFTSLLLIVSGHMLDYRYGYIVFPCFFLLMVYGMKQLVLSKHVLLSYLCVALLLTIMFNLRMA